MVTGRWARLGKVAATLAIWLAFLLTASAHKMQMIRGDLSFAERAWTADVWLEGWAMYPEDGPLAVPGDPREPGVTGPEWMATLDDKAWNEMREIGESYLKDSLRPKFAGEELAFQVTFPDLEQTPPVFKLNNDGNALVRCHLQGSLPASGEGKFTISWQDDDGTPLALTVGGESGRGTQVVRLESGTKDKVIIDVTDEAGATVDDSAFSLADWLKAGFVHILPKGLDHICFILGLFLLQPKWKPLLAQTTAFTVAHSITLALVVLGMISVPSRVVESMIALSIAYVGIENLWVKELKPWRVFFIFGLGLLHGMGFASVMQELDIPRGSVVKPLLGFNLGVEAGQVTVLVAAFALTFWAFQKKGFEIFRKLASGAIAAVGLYWTVERLMG